MLISLALALDIVTLILLAYYVGPLITVAIAVAISLVGTYLCVWSNRKLSRHFDRVTQESIGGLPPEYAQLRRFLSAGSCVIMLLFLFPGVLSDVVALFLVLPRLRDDFVPKLREELKAEALRQGKTFEEIVTIKCGKPKD
jgi:UPF0716 family protein affecting phage T7 exclusion